jgi:hypothetical protein
VGFLFIFRALKPFPLPDHRRLLLISVLVLTAFFFIDYFFLQDILQELFLQFFADLPINVNISALLIIPFIWGLFYFVFKRILKQDDNISIIYLTMFGCLIVLFSELIFQVYRLTMSEMTNLEKLRTFLIAVLGSAVLSGFMGFSTAVDIKIKNRLLTWVINVGTAALLYFSSFYLLNFIKGE